MLTANANHAFQDQDAAEPPLQRLRLVDALSANVGLHVIQDQDAAEPPLQRLRLVDALIANADLHVYQDQDASEPPLQRLWLAAAPTVNAHHAFQDLGAVKLQGVALQKNDHACIILQRYLQGIPLVTLYQIMRYPYLFE